MRYFQYLVVTRSILYPYLTAPVANNCYRICGWQSQGCDQRSDCEVEYFSSKGIFHLSLSAKNISKVEFGKLNILEFSPLRFIKVLHFSKNLQCSKRLIEFNYLHSTHKSGFSQIIDGTKLPGVKLVPSI
jgi:hypothetical protein